MKLHVKPPKYHNTPVEVDGIRFDSKAEAARYVQLKALRAAGRILWFTRQPSFLLLGNTRYRPDFMAVSYTHLDVYKRQESGLMLIFQARAHTLCKALSAHGMIF